MPTINKVWTIIDVLNWSENFLKTKGLTDPRHDAEQLLMATLNVDRLFLYVNHDRPLEQKERDIYRQFILRRAKQEPLQYITGFTYFYGLKFLVSKEVLIPRPDTEILVEKIISIVKNNNGNKKITIIDIGTGSGAIAVALAKNLPDTKFIAVDVSRPALAVAKKNAVLNGVQEAIKFYESNILEKIIHEKIENDVFLIANPPYIDLKDFQFLPAEIRKYEPAKALYAGRDGLRFYRLIVDQAVIFGHKLAGVFFEVGYNQAALVKNILEKKFHSQVEIQSDLGGISRVVYTLLTH